MHLSYFFWLLNHKSHFKKKFQMNAKLIEIWEKTFLTNYKKLKVFFSYMNFMVLTKSKWSYCVSLQSNLQFIKCFFVAVKISSEIIFLFKSKVKVLSDMMNIEATSSIFGSKSVYIKTVFLYGYYHLKDPVVTRW